MRRYLITALLAVALATPALTSVALGDDVPGDLPAPAKKSAATADPGSPFPPGHTAPTHHEGVVVPAEPEDPNAPARTYGDPTPAYPGDESANHPIPEYLKGSPYRLSFVNGDYAPPAHEKVDPRLLEGLGRASCGHTYGYVMFEGEIQARKREALEKLGLVFFNEHTFNCLQAWIPARALSGLRVSPFVRWVGYARPEQKVDQFILTKLMDPKADPTEELAVFVNVFESDLGPRSREVPIDDRAPPVSTNPREIAMRATVTMTNGPLQGEITRAGGRVMGYEESIHTFYVWANRIVLRRLMALDFVAGIDTAFPPEPDLDRSLRMTQASYVGNISSYSGADASVAIADSGFHHAHRDLSQTYALGWDYSGESNTIIDNCGHGTHVAGILLGDGTARTDRRYRGSAPKTGTKTNHAVLKLKLFKGSCGGGTNYPNYCPTAWARTTTTHSAWSTIVQPCSVVQNSWGDGYALATGYYGTDSVSRASDTNTHTYRQLYVMSGGNQGGSRTSTVFKSTRPPSVAKSAFSVGSVVDWDDTSGYYANRYPGAHRFSSSKGSTRDGRVKPQISAPGTWIVSAKTNSTSLYISKGGTSMSAPHVSGVAAMMHDASSTYRTYPCLSRAKMMAAAMPYAGTRSWSTGSESYYNRRGMGELDAYATIFSRNVAGGWLSGYSARTLTRSSSGFYFDVTVPADATRTFFVMSWDEKAPALNATKAVLYNLDMVLDVEPFDPDINKGEYVSRRTNGNYEWYGNTGSIAAVRGKKIRVKIPFLTKPTSTTEVVRVGVAYHIPRGDYTPALTLTASPSPRVVKPGAPFTFAATAATPYYRAGGIYMWLTPPTGATATTLTHVTRDGRTLQTYPYVGSTDSRLNWTIGQIGPWHASSSRTLTWNMRAPSTNGSHAITVQARGDATNSALYRAQICVDGQSPKTVTGLVSGTHTRNVWSNRTSFSSKWTAAVDVGCAGVEGYGVKMASGASTPTSRNLGLVTTYGTTFPASANSRWYMNLRTFDKAGNASGVVVYGPLLIDTVAPIKPLVSIEGGAAVTRKLTVTLSNLTASDLGAGVTKMRFSSNGSTWSPWTAYATKFASWNLSSYGGSTARGLKRVYVQYQDGAGNVSTSGADTITYEPLAITSVSPTRGTLIGGDVVTIYGRSFTPGTVYVYFDGVRATAVAVASSTRLTCRTPAHLTWEPVDVRVRIGADSATRVNGYQYVGAEILATGHPRLDTAFPITFNAPVDGGKRYVAAASFGSGPIALSPHGPLALSPDTLFLLTLHNLIPSVFGGLQANLNASGRAAGTITLPDIPAIVGLDVRMGFVTLDLAKPIGIRTVSRVRSFRMLAKP